MARQPHCDVQIEAVRIGAQRFPGLLPLARHRARAEHLLAGARTQGDAICARGRLQRRQRILRIRLRQPGHALLFDQITSPREQFHQPRDDLPEHALELIAGGGSRRTEDGVALGAPNHLVEHPAVQVDVRFSAEPNRWISVTLPASAAPRLRPACSTRNPVMTRCTMPSTGVSNSGWGANRIPSGIGNDSTHCLTGTRGMTGSTR
jgi:hypothetical protein